MVNGFVLFVLVSNIFVQNVLDSNRYMFFENMKFVKLYSNDKDFFKNFFFDNMKFVKFVSNVKDFFIEVDNKVLVR